VGRNDPCSCGSGKKYKRCCGDNGNRLLEAALLYRRELGWSVIPVEPKGKRPLVRWEQYQHEPASEDQIRAWWTEHPTANIGIVTGQVSGIVVLDVDGPEGAQSLEQQPEIEPTAMSATSRGTHLFFKHPGDVELRNFARKLPGLDFRGDGGYIVAPPSIHSSDHVYSWSLWPHQQPSADLPGWLRDLVSANGYVPTATAPLAEAKRIREGGRNDALTRLAGSMRRRGFTPEAIEAALIEENERRCDPPLPEKEVREIARSVGRYEPTAPVNGKPEKQEVMVELPALRCLADVQPEDVEWLWHPRIPLRRLTSLESDPGEGKTFLALAVATALSRGQGLPDVEAMEPGNTVFLTAEDNLSDTIRPRLDEMGADVIRVFAIDEPFPLDATGLSYLETLIRSTSARLVVFDPITAFLPPGLDIYRSNEVRAVLSRLAHVAEAHKCAIMIIRHLAKGSTSKAIYRGLGSIDFTAACRSVLLAGHAPDDPTSRALVQIKTNLGPIADPLGYSIEEGQFRWNGATTLTAAQILAPEGEISSLVEAKTLLRDILADGPRDAKEVEGELKAAGISKATIRRAKKALRLEARKKGAWFNRG